MLYHRHRTWNPWREMEGIQRDMNRLFGRMYNGERGAAGTGEFPPVNVWAGTDDVKVVADVPGLDPDALDISVLGNTLTISGERKPDESKEGTHYHRRERGYGKFIRTIELPVDIDSEKVAAECVHGRLTVTLPRAEAAKPKQIAVKA